MNSKHFLLGLLLLLGSCRTDKELDSLAPASERKQSSISETVSTLEGHTGYWRMIYYPDKEQSYGGYSFYLTFADGRVTAFSELDDTAKSSSYNVLNIDMPTLTFDTRNDILHHFSTATEYFRNARGGDFELLLMGKDADTIFLQGRKTLTHMRLEKMSTTPTEEVTAIRQMRLRLQGKGIAPTTIGTEAGITFRLVPTYRQLEYTPAVAAGEKSRSHKIPFRYTSEGIAFYQPVTIGGITLSALQLSSAGDALVSPDGTVSLTLTDPPLDLMNKRYEGKMVKDSASDLFYRSLTSVNRTMRRSHSTTLSTTFYLGINTASDISSGLVGNDTRLGAFIFHPAVDSETSSNFLLAYDTDFVGVGADPTLIDIVPLDGNESSYWYAYDSAKQWINLFQRRAPYRVTSSEASGQTVYRLTSTKDDKYWFDLTLSE